MPLVPLAPHLAARALERQRTRHEEEFARQLPLYDAIPPAAVEEGDGDTARPLPAWMTDY